MFKYTACLYSHILTKSEKILLHINHLDNEVGRLSEKQKAFNIVDTGGRSKYCNGRVMVLVRQTFVITSNS